MPQPGDEGSARGLDPSIGTDMVVEKTRKGYAQSGVKVHAVTSTPPREGASVSGNEISDGRLAEWRRRVDGRNVMLVPGIASTPLELPAQAGHRRFAPTE